MTKETSKFRDWFELQFGNPPSRRASYKLREGLQQLEMQCSGARKILNEMERYELRKQAALYAWVAREKNNE